MIRDRLFRWWIQTYERETRHILNVSDESQMRFEESMIRAFPVSGKDPDNHPNMKLDGLLSREISAFLMRNTVSKRAQYNDLRRGWLL